MAVIERALCPILVGRETEIDSLEDALLSAARGEGGVVVVEGEAGMGKTRLCLEAVERARRIGLTTLWGGFSEADLQLPYLAIVEAMGNYISSVDIEWLRQELSHSVFELAGLFPQLGPPSTAQSVDPSQARLRLFESILSLLDVAAGSSGLLLVIEDLHWSDRSSRDLLDYVVRRLSGKRVVLLVNYRSDEMHRKHPLLPVIQSWRRSGLIRAVTLNPLSPRHIGDMTKAIFDIDEVTGALSSYLHERTDGNPFVVEELLKEVVDLGIRIEPGWEKELDKRAIPQTVSDGILLRVERLGAEVAETLGAAAVLGASFPYALLTDLSELSERALRDALEVCLRNQLLVRDRQGHDVYRFRHALTLEAIYEDLIPPVRQLLHSRAADLLIARGDIGTAVARHLMAAGRFDEATQHFASGAQKALWEGGQTEAVELYELSLPHVHGLERARTLCNLGFALWSTGEPAKAMAHLTSGIDTLEASGLHEEAARFRLTLARCHWEKGRSDLALAEYELARDVLEQSPVSWDLVLAYVRLAALRIFDYETGPCIELCRKAIGFAEQIGADDLRYLANGYMAMAKVCEGDEEGWALMEESYREALRLGHTFVAAAHLNNAIENMIDMLRAKETPPLIDMHASLSSYPVHVWYEWYQGNIAFVQGNVELSLELHRRVWEALRERGFTTWTFWVQRSLGLALIELDRLSEAQDFLVDPSHEIEKQDKGRGGLLRIRYHLAAGDVVEAGAEADALRKDGDWITLFGAIGAEVAEALHSAGDREAASEVVESMEARALRHLKPYAERERARIILDADPSRAIGQLESSIAAFAEAGYRLEEISSRLLLVEAKAGLGLITDAQTELNLVVAMSRDAGSALKERRALELSEKLGLTVAETKKAPAPKPPGEPREALVTVLFADVRGYTAMTRAESPKEMSDRIGALQRWAQREVVARKGVIEEFAGDSVVAFFNVDQGSLDHCEQAFEAARALRDKASFAGLALGIGIAVGPAVVGGFQKGGSLGAIGDPTNLAARLQAQAAAGEILLSEEAYRRLKDRLQAEPEVRKLDLKGYDSPVTAFAL